MRPQLPFKKAEKRKKERSITQEERVKQKLNELSQPLPKLEDSPEMKSKPIHVGPDKITQIYKRRLQNQYDLLEKWDNFGKKVHKSTIIKKSPGKKISRNKNKEIELSGRQK